ncbi:MAG: EcsC family protein [Albidovulum sp.]|jgi:hypothetical protein
MSDPDPSGEIDLLPEDLAREVAGLAHRARAANGPVMKALNAMGGRVEAWAAKLPAPAREVLDKGAARILASLFDGAANTQKIMPDAGAWGHRFAAAASGAVGGSAGLASAVVELPATVMLMFGAMLKVAAENGFDPDSEEVRLTCIDIFGSGGPGTEDDGVNTTFLGSRMSVNGATLQAVITRVSPAFSAMLGKQLAGKAVPILGAVAGAGINYSFMSYYEDVARVRFGLKRLALEHGRTRVGHAFRAEMARQA